MLLDTLIEVYSPTKSKNAIGEVITTYTDKVIDVMGKLVPFKDDITLNLFGLLHTQTYTLFIEDKFDFYANYRLKINEAFYEIVSPKDYPQHAQLLIKRVV